MQTVWLLLSFAFLFLAVGQLRGWSLCRFGGTVRRSLSGPG